MTSESEKITFPSGREFETYNTPGLGTCVRVVFGLDVPILGTTDLLYDQCDNNRHLDEWRFERKDENTLRLYSVGVPGARNARREITIKYDNEQGILSEIDSDCNVFTELSDF